MNAIVAVDENWGIGKDGGMLFHLPGDLKYFREMTRGKTLLMGRATLDSLPGGRPLPGRVNLVLSRDPGFKREGVTVLRSFAELKRALSGLPGDEVMLIGGGSLYAQLIDCCKTAYVTKIAAAAPADSFFPKLDARPGWILASCSENHEDAGISYRFCEYRNSKVLELPAD